jgi:hypothetical protein
MLINSMNCFLDVNGNLELLYKPVIKERYRSYLKENDDFN